MKSLTKIHLTLFAILFLISFITYASLSSAGASDIITSDTTTAVGRVQYEGPEHFFTGESYSLQIIFSQTSTQEDQHYVAHDESGFELQINEDIIPIYSYEYTQERSIVTWHIFIPPDPGNSFQLHYYVHTRPLGDQEESVLILDDYFYPVVQGVEGAPCDAYYPCNNDLDCVNDGNPDYNYCRRPLGEEGSSCISYADCDMEQGLICYVDWDSTPTPQEGICVIPLVVGLGETCDWEYRRCNETRQHHCSTPNMLCVAQLGSIDNPSYGSLGSPCDGQYYLCEEDLFCNMTADICQEEPLVIMPEPEDPTYANYGEACDNDIIFCLDPYECIDGFCNETSPVINPPPVDLCEAVDCETNHTCYEGQCVYCPAPHELSPAGVCEAQCLENSEPTTATFIHYTNACVCILGFEQNNTDEYGRPLCVPRPREECVSILDCEENYTCLEGICTPCPPPYKKISLGGQCEWNCAPNSNTKESNLLTDSPKCICKPGHIPDYRDALGRLMCKLKPANYCDNQYYHCDDDHKCIDNLCIETEKLIEQTPPEEEQANRIKQREIYEAQQQKLEEERNAIHEEIIIEVKEEQLQEQQIPASRERQAEDLIIQHNIKQKEIDEAQERAKTELIVEKTRQVKKLTSEIRNDSYRTEITIHVIPKENQESIDIIEIIPKELAGSISELVFSQPPIILEDDPIVMWHLENVNEQVDLTYSVNKDVGITGNTMALASAKPAFDWKVLLPLLFIPLIALLVVFFDKLRSSPKKVF